MVLRCIVCGKELKPKEERIYIIPVKVCAITNAITIRERIVAICKECEEKKGRPIEEYMGRIIFSKNG